MKPKRKESSIIDQCCWLQNREVYFIDCIWGVFNWLIHYFFKHKGEFWESFFEAREVVRSCFQLFCCRLVEKHSGNVFFQTMYLFLAFPKNVFKHMLRPLYRINLLQRATYNSKAEVWMLNFNIYRGQNYTHMFLHTNAYLHIYID